MNIRNNNALEYRFPERCDELRVFLFIFALSASYPTSYIKNLIRQGAVRMLSVTSWRGGAADIVFQTLNYPVYSISYITETTVLLPYQNLIFEQEMPLSVAAG